MYKKSRLAIVLDLTVLFCAFSYLSSVQAQSGRPDDPSRGSPPKTGSKSGSRRGGGSKTSSKGGSTSRELESSKNKLGRITLTVNPLDSNVTVDNQQVFEAGAVGGTLVINDLSIGSHILTVRRDGYREQQRAVDVKTGDNPIQAMILEPLKGTLNIRPSVDGASIELRSIGRNQNAGSYAGAIDQVDFPPGEYEITISKPGYATATRTVTLKAGATVELEPRLDPLPPPKPAPKPRPRPMSARVETDGKYLIVRLSGTSDDDSSALGSINVSVSKSTLAFPEVSGTLNGAPCRIEFFKLENIDEGSLIETPSPSNQYSVIVVRIRPKDSKRPVRFAINWKSIASARQSPETVSTSDNLSEAAPTRKVLPTIPTLARSSQTLGSVNVLVVIDEQGNVISAKAIEGPVVLRQAAENAARQWKFRPAMRNGIPIQTTQTIRFNFEK
jgi:TonB family protein